MSTTRLNMDTVQDRDLHLSTLATAQTCQTVNIWGWTLSGESSATAHIHRYLLLNARLRFNSELGFTRVAHVTYLFKSVSCLLSEQAAGR